MKNFLKRPLLLITLCITLAVSFDSCIVKFTPTYDAQIHQDASSCAEHMDALYTEMILSTNKNFSSYTEGYANVQAELNALKLKAESRPMGKTLLKILLIIDQNFTKYKTVHQTNGWLTTGELVIYLDYLKSLWHPYLAADNSLK